MAILHQLGINHTTFYCFLVFIVTFFFLKESVFRPYFLAFEERERRTKGGEDAARDLHGKTAKVKAQYEEEARDLNAEIKSIFDESRKLAVREYEKIATEARASADKVVEEARERVAGEIKKAQEQLRLEVPGVALAITKKMLD